MIKIRGVETFILEISHSQIPPKPPTSMLFQGNFLWMLNSYTNVLPKSETNHLLSGVKRRSPADPLRTLFFWKLSGQWEPKDLINHMKIVLINEKWCYLNFVWFIIRQDCWFSKLSSFGGGSDVILCLFRFSGTQSITLGHLGFWGFGVLGFIIFLFTISLYYASSADLKNLSRSLLIPLTI